MEESARCGRHCVGVALRLAGHENRVDPDAWHPMIMNFQHLYGLRQGKIVDSKLAQIEEELYRLPAERKRGLGVVADHEMGMVGRV